MGILLRNGSSAGAAGGRRRARQSLVTAAWIMCAAAGVAAAVGPEPQVTVREERGVYSVAATFGVPQPASHAVAVLTDYEGIPRFMPDVRTSVVLERGDGWAVIEQLAVARLMIFSKRIHLVLEVHEASGIIRFRDRCGTSFARYQGSWTVTERDGHANLSYQLTAEPSFDVPELLLKRLLKRDAMQMIGRLQAEIATKAR